MVHYKIHISTKEINNGEMEEQKKFKRHIGNNSKMADLKLPISYQIKYKWITHSNQKVKIGTVD